jgi:hypothetical protein
VVHQVGDDLGVGLALEDVALGLQLGAQLFVVLDDAVVHQGDLVAREVRVGVGHGRRAVGGPAGVGNADQALHVILVDLLAQLGHAGGGAGAAQRAALDDGHAAGVIAPVFQALQALDQDGNHIGRADGADDATHELLA